MNTKNTEGAIKSRKTPRYIIGFECVAQKYNPNTAFVLGKIYNLELHGAYNEFRGSMDWLSRRCGLTRGTTVKIVQNLLKNNLIIDSTPEKDKNKITSVKRYIVNTIELYELSEEMNILVDEATTADKIKNGFKKELMLKNNSKKYNPENIIHKEIMELFEEVVDYEDPFEEL